MKNIILLSSVLSLLVLLSSCDKKDSLPADSTLMGEIVLSRVRVGTNQNIVFACPVSIVPQSAEVSIQWETSNGITVEQDSYDKGISYKTLSWSNAGEYTVKCKVQYLYGASEFKNTEKSSQLTVCKPHFLNSFIGDGLETVMTDNPDVIKDEVDEDYTYKESDDVIHHLYFIDGIFYSGITLELKRNKENSTLQAGYSLFIEEIKKYEKELKDKIETGAVIIIDNVHPWFNPTEIEQAIIDKVRRGEILLDDEQIILDGHIDSGQIRLEAYGKFKEEAYDEKGVKLSIILTNGKEENTYSCNTAVTIDELKIN